MLLTHYHKKRVFEWVSYLADTEHLSFTIKGISDGNPVEYGVPYLHRWHPSYKKRMIAKFYQLDKHFADKFGIGRLVPCTMITFTVQQKLDYSDYDDCFKKLINSFTKFRKILYYYYGQNSWFRVTEPHKSGYPHIHMAYFYDIPEKDYDDLKKLWAVKYGNSDFPDIALDFKRSSEYENSNNLKSVKNYLVKYLTKTFNSSNMSATAKLFHSTMWKFHYRAWTCSRDLSKAMKKESTGVVFDVSEISLVDKKTGNETRFWDKTFGKLPQYKIITDEVWLAEITFGNLRGCGLLERADRVQLLDYGHYKKWVLYKLVHTIVPI